MKTTLSTAIAAPFGGRWVTEFVTRDKKTQDTKVECLILVFDRLEDLLSHYGEATVNHFVMGTSFRVIQQGIWRHSEKATPDELCARIVAFRHGQRAVAIRTVEKYIGPDDVSYETRELAAAAWKAYYTA